MVRDEAVRAVWRLLVLRRRREERDERDERDERRERDERDEQDDGEREALDDDRDADESCFFLCFDLLVREEEEEAEEAEREADEDADADRLPLELR